MLKRFDFKQFSLAEVQFSSIWSIDRTLLDSTAPGQSGPGSDGNEGVLSIPQSSSIIVTSPSDCFVSYPGHSLSGEGLTPLQRCSWCILQPQLTEQLNTHLYSSNEWFCVVIIMSCHQHVYPWPSLATSPYRSSLLAGPQGYILCPHRAAVCRFELVSCFCLAI